MRLRRVVISEYRAPAYDIPSQAVVRRVAGCSRRWEFECVACGTARECVTRERAADAAWTHAAIWPCEELEELERGGAE